MADGLLKGYRALDLTDQKGLVCGLILADMGVEVIKVEKPGGDPARLIPPFFHQVPDPEKSLFWWAFNSGKKSLTLDLETAPGQEIFRQLVKTADFVLESFQPGYLDSLGIGYQALSRLNKKIILTSITDFGQKGPYSHYKGSELIDIALSGVLDNTGQPELPPVKECLDAASFHASATAALGTVMSLHARHVSGEGQQVDVSIQQAALTRTSLTLLPWIWDKRLVKRQGPMGMTGSHPVRWTWQCRDGYVFWFFIGGPTGAPANKALADWMREERVDNPLGKIKDWRELDKAALTPEVLDTLQKAIADFFLRYTKKELEEEGMKRGVNTIAASNPAEVLKNRQYQARGYWKDIDHPEVDKQITYPGYFFLSSETENVIHRRAPLIGENNEEIYRKELGFPDQKIDALKGARVI